VVLFSSRSRLLIQKFGGPTAANGGVLWARPRNILTSRRDSPSRFFSGRSENLVQAARPALTVLPRVNGRSLNIDPTFRRNHRKCRYPFFPPFFEFSFASSCAVCLWYMFLQAMLVTRSTSLWRSLVYRMFVRFGLSRLFSSPDVVLLDA